MFALTEKTLRSLKAISAVMAIIANYPTHVNGAYVTNDDAIDVAPANAYLAASTTDAAEAEA